MFTVLELVTQFSLKTWPSDCEPDGTLTLIGSSATRRRRHEFWAYRIGDGLAYDTIDLTKRVVIERPSHHVANRVELLRMPSAP